MIAHQLRERRFANRRVRLGAKLRRRIRGVAERRELLVRLPFATGYGVEIAMLIDVWREVGLELLAMV